MWQCTNLLYSIIIITSTIPTTAPIITTASTAATVGTEEPGASVVIGDVVRRSVDVVSVVSLLVDVVVCTNAESTMEGFNAYIRVPIRVAKGSFNACYNTCMNYQL